jgi:hypothetical protein
VNGDDTLDVVFGTSKGKVIGLHGPNGAEQWSIDLAAHYGDTLEIDHGPIIADFDLDGDLDVFVVGGQAKYPNIQGNYGRAYAISVGQGSGPDWPMFRRDIHRQACVCPDSSVNTGGAADWEKSTAFEAYPNPAVDRMFFNLQLESQAEVQLELVDLQGKRVALLASGRYAPGNHQFVLDRNGFSMPGGIYLAVLKVDNKVVGKTRILLN